MSRIAWVLGACLSSLAAAADGAAATVGTSEGHLAVAVEPDGWRVLPPGSDIPPQAAVRTSPAGPCRVELEHGTLVIAADSRLRLDLALRRIDLDAGRVLLDVPDDAAWTVAAVDRQEQPVRGAAAIALAADGALQVAPKPEDGWADDVKAWAEAKPAQGVGNLVVRDPQSGAANRLEVARYHVNVVLRPPVALVQIDQSFYNPYLRQEEGTFVFNLPQGASVSRFAMFVTHDTLIEGELIERKRASDIYESIVRSKRDPAILEQIGDNLFRMRVFPIFARDTKRILLDYTVPLVPADGEYHFRLPLLSDLEPIWDFRVAGAVRGPIDPQSVASGSHPELAVEPRDDGTVAFEVAGKDVQPHGDFSIHFREPEQTGTTARGYVAPPLGDEGRRQYLLVSIPADKLPRPQPDTGPADVVVLADTSGSVTNQVLVRRAVRTVVGNLRPDDRVRLGCVDVDWRPLTDGWVAPETDAVRDALTRLEREFALGATNLRGALEAALSSFDGSDPQRRRVVVYVGDGRETDASPRVGTMIDRMARDRIAFSAVRLGDEAAGAKLLAECARATRGRVFAVGNDSAALGEPFAWVLRGMPRAVAVKSVTVAGAEPENVFASPFAAEGTPLYVYARIAPAPRAEVAVTLVDGEDEATVRETAPLPDDEEDLFVGRLWAQRKLERLLASGVQGDEKLREQVVPLSQEWSLLSPHTAFLVLETEQDYGRWGIDRRLRHRYWKPAEALPAVPLPERVVRREAARPDRRETRPEKLREALDKARDLLKSGRPEAALTQLAQAERLSHALQQPEPEVPQLRQQAFASLRQRQFLSRLGLWRPLVERDALPLVLADPAVVGQVPINDFSSEFLEIHPHAKELLKEVQPRGRMSFKDFVDYLQKETGANIVLDEVSLQEEGISTDDEVDFHGIRRISLRSLAARVLEPYALTLVDGPHVMEIMTGTKANERFRPHIYPVPDLIRTDVPTPPGWLSNPYLDRRETARKRIEEKLRKPTSIEIVDIPLQDAVDFIADQMDENVVLDETALQEEGISTDQPVTITLNDVPTEVALRVILEPLALQPIVEDETLVLMTLTKASEKFVTRIYPARGLIYRMDPKLESQFRAARKASGWYGGGFGGYGGMGGFGGAGMGMGGMGFGGMGGMGGFGGGFFGGGGFGETSQGSLSSFGGEDASGDDAGSEAFFGSPGGDAPATSDASDFPDFSESMNILMENTSGEWEMIDQVGGSMSYHTPTMSLVVRQTQDVHREIGELFDRLRRLPAAGAAMTPAEPPRIGPDQPAGWNMGQLMQLVMETTSGEWMVYDQVGGSMNPHVATLALIIRQTAPVHEEIYELLTRLRRIRYGIGEEGTVRTASGETAGPMLLSLQPVTQFPAAPPQPTTPPDDEERNLLAPRRESSPAAARWRWRRAGDAYSGEVALRRREGRTEAELPGRRLRIEGERAAVAYPDLTLVEIGPWGDDARRLLDAVLPWFPHRTNDELARMFEVRAGETSDESVSLRLAFPDGDGTHIDVTYPSGGGLPTRWDAYAAGELRFRLRFADPVDVAGTQVPKLVVAEDAGGREIERWEWRETDNPSPEIPGLAEGWGEEMVVLDPIDRLDDSPYGRAKRRMQEGRFDEAARVLREALTERPDQPLLNFLLACCGTAAPDRDARRDEVRQALERVALGDAGALRRAVSPESFPTLPVEELYAIAQRRPHEARTADDWDYLSRLAARAGRTEEALSHIEDALRLDADPGARLRDRRRQVDLLLTLGRVPRAEEIVRELLDSEKLPPDEIAALADLFGRRRQPEIADDFYRAALSDESLSDELRFHLTERQARWHDGPKRWRMLLAAAERWLEADERAGAYRSILLELSGPHAAVAGQLAAETTDPAFRVQLLLRQAELSADRTVRSAVLGGLYDRGELPPERFDWAVDRLSEVGASADVVRLLEERLRRGRTLGKLPLSQLTTAYAALEREAPSPARETALRRAESQRQETAGTR